MSNGRSKILYYFIMILILSIVGAFTSIVFMYGGWIQSEEYANYYHYAYFLLSDHLEFDLLILIIIIFFIYSTVLSIISLTNHNYVKPLKYYKVAMIFMLSTLILTILILLMVIIYSIGATSWWIGPAFYAGSLSSLLNVIVYLIIIKFLKKNC
jgi:hypothetical protein